MQMQFSILSLRNCHESEDGLSLGPPTDFCLVDIKLQLMFYEQYLISN